MVKFLSKQKWESRSALISHMDASAFRALVIAIDAEAPKDYYSFIADLNNDGIEIGVISSGHGTEASAVLLKQDEYALVGHDSWITSIETNTLTIIARLPLAGPFFEFFPIDSEDEIVIFHEIGVMRINGKAEVKWSVETDIIEGWTNDGKGNIVLTVMDSPQLTVSLSSGKAEGSKEGSKGSE